MKEVLILGNPGCSRCSMTKKILEMNGVPFSYKHLNELPEEESRNYLAEAREKGSMSMPILIVDGEVQSKSIQEVIASCK